MRLVELYARLSPRLAHRPGASLASRAHAWILSRSGGKVGKTLFGSPLLVLRTTGRKSGNVRESPMLFVEHRTGYAVVASNAASSRPPAWWFNLGAQRECEAFIGGRWRALRARAATDSEAAELWPELDSAYAGFEHYREVATRSLPVVILEPR
jgi:F420H(2)-dependent quinone reductase